MSENTEKIRSGVKSVGKTFAAMRKVRLTFFRYIEKNSTTKVSMKTKIGGQAVIEGVMMRGERSMALSVRDEMGRIREETYRLPEKKPWYRKVPFLRGIVNLVISMADGFKIIGKSAEVMAEDVDTSEGKGFGGIMFMSVLLGLLLAVALFIIVPTAVTTAIFELSKLDEVRYAWLKSLIEGVCKLLVLIGYMGGISRMQEIRRVFMYHGAEHKTIACYEAEMPLTVENVQKCSRYHDRCGTSFIVFVVVLSVVLMMVLDVIFVACNVDVFVRQSNWWLRALLKIALLPVTAGFSYEMLMLLARSNFVLFRPLKWLGKQFQKLTTREPDDGMCEVAIRSFNNVLEMDADVTIPEKHFEQAISLQQFRARLEESGIAQKMDKADLDWLLCVILNVKRSDLQKDIKIPFGWTIKLEKYAGRIAEGEPLQYVLGNTEFYGRTFEVNPSVLIPRPETELVTEQAVKRTDSHSKVLDMCCGSGAIGITIAMERGAKVTLSDVSAEALKVAKANAKKLKAKCSFVQGDMFGNVKGKYDVIVCNPPYVKSQAMAELEEKVKQEPSSALDGGEDGLKYYRIIAQEAPRFLTSEGTLILEIGYDQGAEVTALMKERFDEVTLLRDYAGLDRIVVATKVKRQAMGAESTKKGAKRSRT